MTVLLEKRCPTCGIIKNIEQFSLQKDTRDGRRSQCKECSADYRRGNPVLVQTANMVKNARQRAKTKNLAFNIDHDFVRSIIPSHCPIFNTKLEWSAQRGNGNRPLPNSPSLDRIDPTKGYTKDNVWIISYKANTIKSNASHEELKLVAEAVGRAIVNSLEW
jgi:hypothetical protein